MENSLFNILDIFKGCIIRIPAFQRGYSWEDRQLNELWKDILNLEPYFDTCYHFTGILVFEELNELPPTWVKEVPQVRLIEHNLKPLSLVDGQQRMTTILILLFVLVKEMHEHDLNKYFKFTDREKLYNQFLRVRSTDSNLYLFGYEIDTPSHQYLLNKIFEDDSVVLEEPKTVYTQNLEDAKSFFHEQLKDFPTSETRFRILYIILNQLKFSRLLLKPDEIDISMVFETLNFRGKPLSHLELLKNRLLYLLARNKDRVQNYESLERQVVSTWLTIYEYLGKVGKRWINEDEFLKSYWLIYFNHDNRVKGQFNDFVQDIFDNIFPIKSGVNDQLEYSQIKRFLKNLSLSIRTMFYIYNPDQIENCSDNEFNQVCKINDEESITNLKRLNELRTGWQPAKNIICTYVISDNYNAANLSEILILLERHNFLLYNLYGKKSDTNSVYMFRLANRIFRSNNHAFIRNYIADLIESETSDFNAIGNFVHRSKAKNNRFYDWIGIDYLLREYERFLISGGSLSYYENLSRLKKFLVYNPEIRNYGFNEFPAGSLRLNFAYSLGNIFLAPHSRVNEEYSILVNKISRNGTHSEMQILGTNYDANLIYARGVKILMFIEKRWKKKLPFDRENEIKRILFDAIPNNVSIDENLIIEVDD